MCLWGESRDGEEGIVQLVESGEAEGKCCGGIAGDSLSRAEPALIPSRRVLSPGALVAYGTATQPLWRPAAALL